MSDIDHEYVPHEWRDIASGTRRACRERIAQLERELNEARLELRAVVNGTDQGIVALVVSVIEHRIRSERCEAEANNLAEALRQVNARLVEVADERDEWKEAAAVRSDCCIELVKVKNERDKWQKIAQDTRDEAREYVSELRDLSEWKRGYPRYVEELGRLDAFIAAMKDDLK